jgi:hypothetical protein
MEQQVRVVSSFLLNNHLGRFMSQFPDMLLSTFRFLIQVSRVTSQVLSSTCVVCHTISYAAVRRTILSQEPLKGVYNGKMPCAKHHNSQAGFLCPTRLSMINSNRNGGK